MGQRKSTIRKCLHERFHYTRWKEDAIGKMKSKEDLEWSLITSIRLLLEPNFYNNPFDTFSKKILQRQRAIEWELEYFYDDITDCNR